MLPIFLIPIIVGLVTQGIKMLIAKVQYNVSWRQTPSYGGIPSAHTAFAASLATAIGYYEGANTAAFAIAIALVIYVLDDALRMRVFLGNHAKILEILTQYIKIKKPLPRLEKRLGHKLVDVIVGGIWGVTATFFLIWLF